MALTRIGDKLGVSEPRVYALIAKKVRETHLPRHLAALALAADHGINVAKKRYATDAERLLMAGAATRSSNGSTPVSAPPAPRLPAGVTRRTRRQEASDTVMVVHGRDLSARDSMFQFLRALGLKPMEFQHGIARTKKGAPHIGEVVEAMFKGAKAVVVLLTPDDEARLRRRFLKASDPAYERRLTGQARANVLFEAGRAFGSHPNTTILVQVGEVRPFSDTAGVHVIRLGDDDASRNDLATRLKSAGCSVNTSGRDWLTVGRFRV